MSRRWQRPISRAISRTLTSLTFVIVSEERPEKVREAFGVADDVVIGISTSGNSENVLRAIDAAHERKMTTVGMTGGTGGRLKASVDYCLVVPADQTPRVQECHIMLGHIICDLVERSLFDE